MVHGPADDAVGPQTDDLRRLVADDDKGRREHDGKVAAGELRLQRRDVSIVIGGGKRARDRRRCAAPTTGPTAHAMTAAARNHLHRLIAMRSPPGLL